MKKSKLDKIKEMTRKEVCDFVKENWDLFKVCDSCDAVVTYKTHICPNCSSYRFDNTEERIKKQTLIFKNQKKEDLFKSDLF